MPGAIDTNNPAAGERFRRELGRLLARARGRAALHGALGGGALAGAVALAAVWALGGEAPRPPWLRTALLALGLLAVILAAARQLSRLGRPVRDRAALAEALEAGERFDNLLVAAEEAGRRPERWAGRPGTSPALVERLFAAAAPRLAGVRLGRALPLPAVWRTPAAAALVAAAWLLAGATAPQRLAAGWERLANPGRGAASTPVHGLYLAPGPGEVLAGEAVTLAARDFGRDRGPVQCEVRSGGGLWQAVPCRAESTGAGRAYQLWSARLLEVRESFHYRFRRGGTSTPAGRVEVVHPPLLTAWGGRLEPPAYTRLPAQDLPQLPSRLQAPAGSRLRWRGATSQPLAAAAVVTSAGDTLALSVAGDSLRGEAEIRDPLAYTVRLRDRRGLENPARVVYEVAVLPDAPPFAALARPGDDGWLPGQGLVELEAVAGDDYGVAGVELLWRYEEGGQAAGDTAWARAPLWTPAGPAAPTPAGTPGRLGVVVAPSPAGPDDPLPATGGPSPPRLVVGVDASALGLLPGDALLLCAEARDNRVPGPPARGRSRVLRLALPSAAEILSSQLAVGEERHEDLAALRRRGEELARDLERLDRELLKDPRPDWTRRQELQAALEQQQALRDALQREVGQLRRDLDALGQSNLHSQELLAKMEEVASLLDQVRSPELERLLAQLRDQAAQLSPEQVREAMEEAFRNQRELLQRLDRAIAMLQEMAREQEMEGLTAVVEKLLREQQALRDAPRPGEADRPETPRPGEDGAEEPPRSSPEAAEDADARAERQQALAEEAARLAERLREALERLAKEAGADTAGAGTARERMQRALEEALRRQAESDPSASMAEAARRLRRDAESREAAEAQERALRELAALYHVLLSGQLDMQMAMQQFAAGSLRRLAGDLLALSQRQEEIAGQVPAEMRGVDTAELRRRQHRLLKAAQSLRDRLQATGGGSALMMMRLLRDMDGLLGELAGAAGSLDRSAGPEARREARDSLAAMNRMVIAMLTAAQQVSPSAGGGGGAAAASRQLQQMAREQAGLNAMADRLQRQLQERGLSQEARARMERLQSDQSGLAGRLRDLDAEERAAPERGRLLGDLEEIAREMERVGRDLGAGQFGEETLRRQERILSRLLDAHNSVRQRDYTERRESRSARRLFAPQAGEPPAAADGSTAPYLRRREPVEKAPLEYRDLVRRYFRSLGELLPGDPAAGGAAQPPPAASAPTPSPAPAVPGARP